jgi:three-Cys-motif partner protein
LRETLSERDPAGRAVVIHGDVNIELPRLLTRISKLSPTLLFLDTEGIDPEWETVRVASEWKTELLINCPLGMSINRNAGSPKVLAYSGTPEWEPLWKSDSRNRTGELLKLYIGLLRELGYEYPAEVPRLIRDGRNHGLYYLVFASKVQVAKKVMDSVFKQPDSGGQGRMELGLGE